MTKTLSVYSELEKCSGGVTDSHFTAVHLTITFLDGDLSGITYSYVFFCLLKSLLEITLRTVSW